MQETTTIDGVAKSIPKIYAIMENQQVDHQALVVEMGGIISNHSISILIDPDSNLKYISP